MNRKTVNIGREKIYLGILFFLWGFGGMTSVFGQESSGTMLSLPENLDVFMEEDENEDGLSNLSMDEKIRIAEIKIRIDGKNFSLADINGLHENNMGSMVQRISLNIGDILTVAQVKQRMRFSQNRLQGIPFIDADSDYGGFSVQILDENLESNVPNIAVEFIINTNIGMGFSGGSIYGYIGFFRSSGWTFDLYPGVSRQEFGVSYEGMPYGWNNGGGLGYFRNFSANVFNYFLWEKVHKAFSDTFMYGLEFTTKNYYHPTIIHELGVGITGLSTIKSSKSDVFMSEQGLPLEGKTGLSADIRNKLVYKIDLGRSDMYVNEFSISVPYVIGWAGTELNSTMKLYDMLGLDIWFQESFKTGEVYHRIKTRAAFVTGFTSEESRPFHAKANLGSGFTNTTSREINMERRGDYPENVTVGNIGYLLSFQYNIGMNLTHLLGLSLFLYYDAGGTTDDYKTLIDNFRHTAGPGLSLHFFDPVNITANLSLGIGGQTLGNPDGTAITFDFSVSLDI